MVKLVGSTTTLFVLILLGGLEATAQQNAFSRIFRASLHQGGDGR